MSRVLSISAALVFCCICQFSVAQDAPLADEDIQHYETAQAIRPAEARKYAQDVGIWPPWSALHINDRKISRIEALHLFHHFKLHISVGEFANPAMVKQRASGGFIHNAADDTMNVYGYFNFQFGSLGDFGADAAEAEIKLGLMRGDPGRRLRAGENLTRGELATMLCRVLLYSKATITLQPDDIAYSDVSGDEWWCGAAQTVSRIHIMEGYPDDTFRGEQFVTYNEALIALGRISALDKANGAKPRP